MTSPSFFFLFLLSSHATPTMAKSALVLLDIQKGIINRLQTTDSYLSRLASTVQKARDASTQIIHVTTAFRPGYPDLNPRNMSTPRIVSSNSFIEGSESVQIHPAISVNPSDILVTKKRVSAFSASDLDVVLRSLGIEHLIIAGVATSGAVLSTVRQASDLDYQLTVLEDLCMDRDQEVHNFLMERIISHQAKVVDWKEWAGGLN